jgi:hypothetical protein
MTQAIDTNQTILERLPSLTPEQQQQVLDFIDLLKFKGHKPDKTEDQEKFISFLEAAQEFIGCVEGDSDLSMRKKELKKGFQKT